MADRSRSLILEALTSAAAAPDGLALFGSKAVPGLFASNAAARQAAQQCQDQGLLQVVQSITKGRKTTQICAITEKGLAYLLEEVSPRPILEALLHALEIRGAEIGQLLAAAEQTRSCLDALKNRIEKVLSQLQHQTQRPMPALPGTMSANGNATWKGAIIDHLHNRQQSGTLDDCLLPELFRIACRCSADLSIGHFHDELRRLYKEGHIFLHPWTGPLYEMPEPACALLVGHEIAYYASFKEGARSQESGARSQEPGAKGQG